MTSPHARLLALAALLAALACACDDAGSGATIGRSEAPVVFGVDDRRDYFEVTDATFADQGRSSVVALVHEESAKGVGLVILTTPHLQMGAACRVQVGMLPILRAEVRWREPVILFRT